MITTTKKEYNWKEAEKFCNDKMCPECAVKTINTQAGWVSSNYCPICKAQYDYQHSDMGQTLCVLNRYVKIEQ